MKKNSFLFLSVILIAGAISSCSQEEEIVPSEIIQSESIQIGPACDPYTATVWADTPYQNSIFLEAHESLIFHTNKVCGATEYLWTVDDQATIRSFGPNIRLEGRYFLWLPPGGCDDFNAKFVNGQFQTNIKVRANTSSGAVSLPVVVGSVGYCAEDEYWDGGDNGGNDGDDSSGGGDSPGFG